MSSHHFVRDGQEPALLVLDTVNFSVAEPLLEWAPTVVVTSRAVEEVLAWGIKIDVVISPARQLESLKARLASQVPVTFITSEPAFAIDSAMHFLLRAGQKAVSILTTRTEVAMHHADNFIDRLTINIISEPITWSGIASGTFKKWLPSGSRLKIRYLNDTGAITIMRNLSKAGDELQAVKDGLTELAGSGPFWVGEVQ